MCWTAGWLSALIEQQQRHMIVTCMHVCLLYAHDGQQHAQTLEWLRPFTHSYIYTRTSTPTSTPTSTRTYTPAYTPTATPASTPLYVQCACSPSATEPCVTRWGTWCADSTHTHLPGRETADAHMSHVSDETQLKPYPCCQLRMNTVRHILCFLNLILNVCRVCDSDYIHSKNNNTYK